MVLVNAILGGSEFNSNDFTTSPTMSIAIIKITTIVVHFQLNIFFDL